MRIVRFFCANFILAIFLMVIPILEIIYGINYNSFQCKESTFYLSSWLLIKGILNCTSLITIFMMVYLHVKNCLITNYFIIVNFLTIVWLLSGTIVFYRDCINIKPYDLNIFIWISILNGYISICNYHFLSSTYEMYTYDIDEPLLII